MTKDDYDAVVLAVAYRLQAKWNASNVGHQHIVKTTVAVMQTGEWRQFKRAKGR